MSCFFSLARFCAAETDVSHGPAKACWTKSKVATASSALRFNEDPLSGREPSASGPYSDFPAATGDKSVDAFRFFCA